MAAKKSKSAPNRYVADHTGSARDKDGTLYEYTAGQPFEAPEGALDAVGGLTAVSTDADAEKAQKEIADAQAQRDAADPVVRRGQPFEQNRGVIDAGVDMPGGTLGGDAVHVGPGGAAANAPESEPTVVTPEDSVSADTSDAE